MTLSELAFYRKVILAIKFQIGYASPIVDFYQKCPFIPEGQVTKCEHLILEDMIGRLP